MLLLLLCMFTYLFVCLFCFLFNLHASGSCFRTLYKQSFLSQIIVYPFKNPTLSSHILSARTHTHNVVLELAGDEVAGRRPQQEGPTEPVLVGSQEDAEGAVHVLHLVLVAVAGQHGIVAEGAAGRHGQPHVGGCPQRLWADRAEGDRGWRTEGQPNKFTSTEFTSGKERTEGQPNKFT